MSSSNLMIYICFSISILVSVKLNLFWKFWYPLHLMFTSSVFPRLLYRCTVVLGCSHWVSGRRRKSQSGKSSSIVMSVSSVQSLLHAFGLPRQCQCYLLPVGCSRKPPSYFGWCLWGFPTSIPLFMGPEGQNRGRVETVPEGKWSSILPSFG